MITRQTSVYWIERTASAGIVAMIVGLLVGVIVLFLAGMAILMLCGVLWKVVQ